MSHEVDRWVSSVAAARVDHRLPPRAGALADTLISSALALLFPHFETHRRPDRTSVRAEVRQLETTLSQFLSDVGLCVGSEGAPTASDSGGYVDSRAAGKRRPL